MAGEYKSYMGAIVRAVRPMSDEVLADREEMGEWMLSVLKGKGAPPAKKRRDPRRDEEVLLKLVRGLSEIGNQRHCIEPGEHPKVGEVCTAKAGWRGQVGLPAAARGDVPWRNLHPEGEMRWISDHRYQDLPQ